MEAPKRSVKDLAVRDIAIGVVMLLIAAVYWIEANKIRISPLDGPVGASGLPKSLAYALGVLALVMISRSVLSIALQRRRGGAPLDTSTVDVEPWAARMRPHLRAIGMLLIGIVYLLCISWLGYIPAIAGLLLLVALYTGAPLGWKTVLFAVIGSIVCYLLFVKFLGIPLPDGKFLGPLLQRLG